MSWNTTPLSEHDTICSADLLLAFACVFLLANSDLRAGHWDVFCFRLGSANSLLWCLYVQSPSFHVCFSRVYESAPDRGRSSGRRRRGSCDHGTKRRTTVENTHQIRHSKKNSRIG